VRILPPAQCPSISQGGGPNIVDISDIGAMVISEPPPTNTNLYTFSIGGPHLNNAAAYKAYTNYTAAGPLDLRVDTNYKLSVYHILRTPTHTDAQVTAFIDFDNSGSFDIPQERVFSGIATATNFFLVGNIEIPDNAIQGVPLMMRVVLNDDLTANPASTTGVGTYISGETEDYYVRFGPKNTPINVENITDIENVGIYPNPTPGIVNIDFSTKYRTNVSIEIVNLTGSILKTAELGAVNGKIQHTVDLSDVAAGVYLMRFTTDNAKFVRKITVK